MLYTNIYIDENIVLLLENNMEQMEQIGIHLQTTIFLKSLIEN